MSGVAPPLDAIGKVAVTSSTMVAGRIGIVGLLSISATPLVAFQSELTCGSPPPDAVIVTPPEPSSVTVILLPSFKFKIPAFAGILFNDDFGF